MDAAALYLVQTDTTVGFLSNDSAKLARTKQRSSDKPFLRVYDTLRTLKSEHTRVPNRFKRDLRRAKATTFVVKHQAFRVIKDNIHTHFISRFGSLLSTSANLSGAHFERDFAQIHADVIVEDARGFYELTPSRIYKLGHYRKERLR